MPRPDYLEAGQIVGTHGVRGEVPGAALVRFARPFFHPVHPLLGQGAVAPEGEIPPAPRTWRSARLKASTPWRRPRRCADGSWYLARGDLHLPEGRHFVQDLIGMAIVDADSGRRYGRLTDVSQTGANPVYHMREEGTGREILIPAIPSVILEVNPETDVIRMRPLKGLLDDED